MTGEMRRIIFLPPDCHSLSLYKFTVDRVGTSAKQIFGGFGDLYLRAKFSCSVSPDILPLWLVIFSSYFGDQCVCLDACVFLDIAQSAPYHLFYHNPKNVYAWTVANFFRMWMQLH
jgi:hypothetical protein